MNPSRVTFQILVILLTLLARPCSQAQSNCTTMVPVTPYKVRKGVPHPVTITDLEIRLNGKPAQVASLERDLTPLRAILVLDASGSMRGEGDDSLSGWHGELYLASKILNNARPGSKFGLLAFRGNRYRAIDVTDPATLYKNMANLKDFPQSKAEGTTPLWDSVAQAVAMLGPLSIHDAVIVFSDGGDNLSKLSEGALGRMLSQGGVRVFTVVFSDSRPRTEEERVGPTEMRDLAETTGGLWLSVSSDHLFGFKANRIPPILDRVAAAISLFATSSYALTFERQTGKKPTSLKVRGTEKGLNILHPHLIPPCGDPVGQR